MSDKNMVAVQQNALVLTNAAALANAILIVVGEQHISRTCNGESLTRDRIEQTIAAKMTNALLSNKAKGL